MKEKKIWITIPNCTKIQKIRIKKGRVLEKDLDGHLWFEESEGLEAENFLRKLKFFLKHNYTHEGRAKWMTEEWINGGKTISRLMYDSTEKDGTKEPMMDYIISWTLRHAANDFKEETPILWKYCRAILGKLIGEDLKKDDTLSEIHVYKQEKKIDLWVEFKLNNKNHAILIENKYYGELREYQLEDYKQKFDDYYKKESSYNKHYCLISCIKRDDKKFDWYYGKAKDLEFKLFSLKELVDGIEEPSESDIFNEFWLEDW